LKERILPIIKEIKLLREKVVPLNIRKLEVLSGKEREELLDDIIQKEERIEYIVRYKNNFSIIIKITLYFIKVLL